LKDKMKFTKNREYTLWLEEIKNKVYTLQIKAVVAVNQAMLGFYWHLGF